MLNNLFVDCMTMMTVGLTIGWVGLGWVSKVGLDPRLCLVLYQTGYQQVHMMAVRLQICRLLKWLRSASLQRAKLRL